MNYKPVPVSKFSKDPVLKSLLKLVASGRIEPKSAQAAAWHLSNKMSWQKLAAKHIKHLGGKPPTPYFTRAQIQRGQMLVEKAKIVAAKEAEEKKDSDAKEKSDNEPRRTASRVSAR